MQTFYDREGNDWDQACLLAKLLELNRPHNPSIGSVHLQGAACTYRGQTRRRPGLPANNVQVIYTLLLSNRLSAKLVERLLYRRPDLGPRPDRRSHSRF